jgi:hypothetical protein
MKQRYEALRRMSSLHGSLRDLDQSRLSVLEREHSELTEDLQSLFTALESGDLVYGAQASLGARAARKIQKRIDDLKGESERVRRKAETHALRAKLAEDAATAAAQAYREHKERLALAELVERTLASRPQARDKVAEGV